MDREEEVVVAEERAAGAKPRAAAGRARREVA
jgi:hypothetical protein